MTNYINFGNLYGAGQRKSYNHPIQSMGAEITKLALIKIYNGIIANEKYKDKVYFMNTIHDEINFSVQDDLIEEIAYESGRLMLHEIPGKPVPISTGLEIGRSMGLTWKFNQDPVTKELTPEYDPLES
jgi:DNA polymerase I-like protein with 3'-5' exonuclease and polymerase domains